MPFYPPSVRYPRIFQDVPCDRCGYNLRGMHVGAQCPECGQFTFSSYNRHRARKFDMEEFNVASTGDPEKPRARAVYKHFRRLDARWLRRLAIGATLLLVGNVLSSGFAWLTWVAVPLGQFPQAARWALHLIAWTFCAVGVMVISSPEPHSPFRYERPIAGVARAGAVVWWLTPLLVFAGPREESGRIVLAFLAVPLTFVALAALGRACDTLEKGRLTIQLHMLSGLLSLTGIILAILLPSGPGMRKTFFEFAPVPGIGSSSTMLAFTDQFRALMGAHDSLATLVAMMIMGLFVWTQVVLLLAGSELRQAARRYAEMPPIIPSHSPTTSLPPV